jgi:maltose O-acetyltransferase
MIAARDVGPQFGMIPPPRPQDAPAELPHRVRRGLRERLAARLRGEQSRAALEAGGLRIGRNVSIARRVSIDPGFLWLVEIGDDTTIAPGVEIVAHDAATKHLLAKTMVQRVTIGRRVYIGTMAIIIPGVTIGDDAVIGAGSLVRQDVPAGSIAVGVPARVVSTTEELRTRHEQLMRERPVWDESWTLRGGIGHAQMEQMYDALADGPGYVD